MDRRADFPVLRQQVNGHPLTYLDNAATTHKPRAVIEAVSRFYEQDNANVHRGVHTLGNRATAAFEAARARAAEFINARSAAEIVFTRGTTEAINLVAQAWGGTFIRSGDRILLTEMEHHSNLVPWQMLARKVGAEVIYAPVIGDEGSLDSPRLRQLLAGPIKLFAFVHVSNFLGTINPVAELLALARERGIVTLLDAAQSAGHMPLNVQELGCDFLAFSGHKMCGPTGIGVLYGRRELLEAMPPWHGGGEMIRQVDFADTTYAEPPHKFEAGTPDIAGAIGLHAAMDYLDAVGREQIFHHDQALAAYAVERLSALDGIRLLGPGGARAGIISFMLPDVHAHDLVLLADEYGIALRGGYHCAQPLAKRLELGSTARTSFYLYNTREEVDWLVEVIRKIRKILAG
ncbi:MAG: SufS family cysteine desulfurase [Verrucomicrobiales bacterium]|nr:SufS family cysteine desulfurase [Verrucomicrobiales bacterium]